MGWVGLGWVSDIKTYVTNKSLKYRLRSKTDYSLKFGKSIREKSTQYFVDSEFCYLN